MRQGKLPFFEEWLRAEILRSLEPPPYPLLPAAAESLRNVTHPLLPYLDGSGYRLGTHLGSGIDKSAYLLLDEKGEPRSDVVLKVSRHSVHCDDNNQCLNEIEMWEWLLEVDHPLKTLFAGVTAIVENVSVPDLRNAPSTCYLCERIEKQQGWDESAEMRHTTRKLEGYFGIYDLHRNNVGVAADGRCVVLDYGLHAGFERVQEDWASAHSKLGSAASPQQILDELSPIEIDEYDSERQWCDVCDCIVSEEHCHCSECDRERRGGEYCARCHTVTNESSRFTHTEWDTTEVMCSTCLRDAREERTTP